MIADSGGKEEDHRLIKKIQERNKEAFELLYKQNYKKLYILSYKYVKQHQIAEEIVHDVYIKIWSTSHQIYIERSLKSYLFRSIVNASLNYLKKEKLQGIKLDEYSQSEQEAVNESENSEAIEQLMIKLEAALELLPPKCKTVMMLSRFEKLKQQQIAERLSISIKTVKNHLTYGFNKMREVLDKRTLL